MSVDRDTGTGRVKAVKRNLFGTVDHEQIRDDLNREMSRILEEKKRKWNFDFENFQPLPGRYKWERVGKRLQTRKSPTESGPACTTSDSEENLCRQITVDTAHSTTRYNLRTRERDLENINVFDFKPIEPARKRLRELGATPVENRATGHCEQQRDSKERKAKTALVDSTVERRSKPQPLQSKRARR
ncbi:uncharacterized protein LOC144662394 [Oculina patagonica]